MIKKTHTQLKKGFTILEMLMVLAIFTIITSVVMFQYGEFNSKTIMSNMAYEVALSIRQAQVYSLSVRGEAGATSFDNHYGVYINKEMSDKEIAFFIDRMAANGDEPDGICSSDGATCLTCIEGGECLEKITLTRDITIDSLCVDVGIEPIDEDGVCLGESVDDLTVTFERPNPNSVIYVDGALQTGSSAAIILKTNFGNKSAILVRPSGQISVQAIRTP